MHHGNEAICTGGLQRTMTPSKETTRPTSNNSLFRHASELKGASALLLYLSEAADRPLTLSQAAFFMMAASADVQGQAATRVQLLGEEGDKLTASVRNSYRQLMGKSKRFPDALEWLEGEENPDDNREKFLRLTSKGHAVVRGALIAMKPI